MATGHIRTHSDTGLMHSLEIEIVAGEDQESDCADALDVVRTARDQDSLLARVAARPGPGTNSLDSEAPVGSWIDSLL